MHQQRQFVNCTDPIRFEAQSIEIKIKCKYTAATCCASQISPCDNFCLFCVVFLKKRLNYHLTAPINVV